MGYRRRVVTLLIIPLFAATLLVMGGCAATGPAVPGQVSQDTQIILEAGRSLDAVGQTFGQTYDLYNNLYMRGQVPEESYRKWVSWASDFQVAYPLAVSAFKAATTPGDRSAALERALKLKTDLLLYFVGAGGTL
jgi:hypothetical protein